MLIPSFGIRVVSERTSLSRRVNANSQLQVERPDLDIKLIKKGEC